MESAWSERDADAMVAQYGAKGVARDLALRVYSARLLGRDKRLVLHGGGNSSLKTSVPDLMGEDADVLCVKGSGWDMADIEPAGLPAVRLGNLLKLRKLEALSDEEMVRVQRANLIDPMAPNPSVETLLHAFLPHRYVDHTHATAILSDRRPARRGGALRRALRQAPGARALHHAGLRAREEGGRDLRGAARCRRARAAEARHLHVRRIGAAILRAHDRRRDDGRGAARAAQERRLQRAHAAAEDRAGRPKSRPSCAAR